MMIKRIVLIMLAAANGLTVMFIDSVVLLCHSRCGCFYVCWKITLENWVLRIMSEKLAQVRGNLSLYQFSVSHANYCCVQSETSLPCFRALDWLV